MSPTRKKGEHVSFQDYSESLSARLHLGKAKIAALVGVCLVVFIVAVIAISSITTFGSGFEVSKAAAAESQAEDAGENDAEESTASGELCVDVAGCVAKPGICYLAEGSRVADAIAAAGGFTGDAAVSSINQARVLADGEQLYVPSVDEAAAGVAGAGTGGSTASAPAGVSANGKVNINTADSAQLQTISGIGQSKADKIIAYRNSNGPFGSVDELTNVSGIGAKTLESIRDSICV